MLLIVLGVCLAAFGRVAMFFMAQSGAFASGGAVSASSFITHQTCGKYMVNAALMLSATLL